MKGRVIEKVLEVQYQMILRYLGESSKACNEKEILAEIKISDLQITTRKKNSDCFGKL